MRNGILLLGNVTLLLALGCADDAAAGGEGGGGGDGPSSGGGDDVGGNDAVGGQGEGGGEGGSNNPPNPRGLGPAPIELGDADDLAAAGSYVLLAKTGITNVTGSSITGGHLGLSPAAASFITGFSLIADATNTFSTSASVVSPGRVYASDYQTPTPSNLTTAILVMEAGYTDGAGRTDPDFLNLGSGEIGGETLAPGLYRWGSAVTIPDDVTIAGGADDTWIFQISDDLDLSTAKQVVLSGGARARNIFWVVAGQVTVHADAHFEGVILSQTAITLQTNASMNGRALAQSLIAIDDNAITAP